jgi:NADH-quinone oxidoreductase subunit I
MGAASRVRGHAAPDRRRSVTEQFPTRSAEAERFHGRHVLNRYEDGMEKCIGCELCAGVCPAVHLRARRRQPARRAVSPGERYGFVYEINYLRCIHCDLCVRGVPDRGDHRDEAVRVLVHQPRRRDLHRRSNCWSDDDGHAQAAWPWELWQGGEDDYTERVDAATAPCGRGTRAVRGRASSARVGRGGRPRAHPPDARTGLIDLIFFVFGVALGGALGCRARRNPCTAALFSSLTLIASRCLLLLAGRRSSPHPLIVYAGAIVVLFLFVIMLLGVDRQSRSTTDAVPAPGRVCSAIALVPVCSRAGTWATGRKGRSSSDPGPRTAATSERSRVLFTDSSGPFEITAPARDRVSARRARPRSGQRRRREPRAASGSILSPSDHRSYYLTSGAVLFTTARSACSCGATCS